MGLLVFCVSVFCCWSSLNYRRFVLCLSDFVIDLDLFHVVLLLLVFFWFVVTLLVRCCFPLFGWLAG